MWIPDWVIGFPHVPACPFRLPGPHLSVPHTLKPNFTLERRRTFAALAMSDELRLDHKLRPGDIALVNNLTLLHAKTAFKARLAFRSGCDLTRHSFIVSLVINPLFTSPDPSNNI